MKSPLWERGFGRTFPPTGPSFEGLIDLNEFSNDPEIIDRLSRARQFDIGGYKDLTAKGRYGRLGDLLDSDEALQNAQIRLSKGVDRGATLARENPAMALSKANHGTIKNLTMAGMQGLSPEQILQLHLKQMEGFRARFRLKHPGTRGLRFIAEMFK